MGASLLALDKSIKISPEFEDREKDKMLVDLLSPRYFEFIDRCFWLEIKDRLRS